MKSLGCAIRTTAVGLRRELFTGKTNFRFIQVCSFNQDSRRRNYHIDEKPSFRNFDLGKIVGIAMGFSLTYNLYKYFQSQGSHITSSDPFSFLYRLRTTLTVSADHSNSTSNGSGDGVNSAPPKHKFNFLADVVEKTAPSVVYVENKVRNPMTGRPFAVSSGSGFIVKPDGLILTNAHVVANRSEVTVKLHDGREFQGTVEDRDMENDLATIRIKANNLPILPLGDSSKLRPGEFVIALGNPLTFSHTVTAGVVSSTHRQSRELGLNRKGDYIQTDAAINIGNSGGPLVNLDGEAIGINTIKVTEGISFAIPSDRAAEFLENAAKNRHTKKPKADGGMKPKKYIGVTMLSLTPSLIEEMQLRNSNFPNVQYGVLVWRVLIQSPAYEGGLVPGDVIIEINGTQTLSASDVYKIIDKDETLKVKVARGSAVIQLNVTPQEPMH